MDKRVQHFRVMIQSPVRKRTKSGRPAASSGRIAEVLRPVEEGGSLLNREAVWANGRPGNNASVRPTAWSTFAVKLFSPARR